MHSDSTAPGSLSGIRVLDLSRVLAGPWCTQMLGDLGADIIKVERPGSGDDTRHWGPPFDATTGDAAYFQCANRNKRSLALDFAHPEGAALLRRLAADCDVLVENFKPGTLERYGLGPQQLREANPRLIVCSISGFGQDGPLRERAGYDFIVQAMGGLMSITGPADAAYKCGVAVADLFTGLHAVVGVLAALQHRERSGLGQHIDLALFDCQLSMLANLASQWLCDGRTPARLGNAHPSIAPYETLPCFDGELVLAVGNDGQFRRCVECLGHAEWAQDPRFASNAQRLANRAALRELLGAALREQSRAHWVAEFEAVGVPATAVATVPEALQHPQALARGMLGPLDPARRDGRQAVQSPLKLSATPVQRRLPPPGLGQHSEELLRGFGLSDAELTALRQAGVISPPPSGWTGIDRTRDTPRLPARSPMSDLPQEHQSTARLAELLVELGSEVGLPLAQALDRLQALLAQADSPGGLLALREPLRRARDAAMLASQIGRLASGRVRPSQSQCALHSALRQAVEMRSREAQARGLQLRLDAADAHVVADPALLASLLQALLDWALWHTRSSIELQLALTSWPAQARLQIRFALRDLDQPASSQPPTLDGLRWMLVEHIAEALGLRLRRDDEAGLCVARAEFPLWREDLSLELPPHAQPAQGHDTQPFAGWLAIVVSADEGFQREIREQMQPLGWALDAVHSVDAAFQICTEALPQAIVVDGALASADLDQWRCHVLAEAPGFCFIEVLPADAAQRPLRPAGGLRCNREQLDRELPALLRSALAPPGELLTFRI